MNIFLIKIVPGIAQNAGFNPNNFTARVLICNFVRNEYQREEYPNRYVCFCTKVENPEYDPWILPHSCGEVCDRLLENPSCSHRCVLLCHPGNCSQYHQDVTKISGY